MAENPATWFLNIRTADKEYSFCCMSKEMAMETLTKEIDRLGGHVVEAELKHPGGKAEKLPLS